MKRLNSLFVHCFSGNLPSHNSSNSAPAPPPPALPSKYRSKPWNFSPRNFSLLKFLRLYTQNPSLKHQNSFLSSITQRHNGQKPRKLLISASYCRNKRRLYQKPRWKPSTGIKSHRINWWAKIIFGRWWRIHIKIVQWPSWIGPKWRDCFANKRQVNRIHRKWAHATHHRILLIHRMAVNESRERKIQRLAQFCGLSKNFFF